MLDTAPDPGEFRRILAPLLCPPRVRGFFLD